MKSLLRLRPYLKPYIGYLVVCILLAIPLAALRFSPLLLVQKLIDEALKDKDPEKLVLFPLYVMGIFTLNFVVRFLHYYCNRIVVARVNQHIKNELFDHVQGLSADYFTTQSTGNLMSRLGNDPNLIDQGIAQINVFFREPAHLLILFGYVFYLNWKLTLVTLVIFPPMAIVFRYSGKALKRYIHRLQQNQADIFATLQESLVGVRVIKTFRLESYIQKKFRERSEMFTRTLLKTAIVEELSHPAIEWISALAIAALLYFGGKEVLAGTLTSGQLISFFGAFAMMQNPIRVLNDMNIKFNSAAAACERIFEIFDWRSRLTESANPQSVSEFKESIFLDRVRFSYPDEPSREILKGVSFEVAKGSSIALVGASGAGKSSLVSLLPRIFDVTGGRILLDGRDIRDYKLGDLRALIAVVSQDVFLFNDTVAENIRCGRLDATDQDILTAAREANALEFIQKLPQGMNTIIGDRGQKLSGGERQRLSIARAFLRKSPILILDEATSNLDTASEKAIQSALEKLMDNRTTIVIAHRLSTIRHVSRIIVMRQGEIVETGKHEELVAKDGEYARFLRLSQTQNNEGELR